MGWVPILIVNVTFVTEWLGVNRTLGSSGLRYFYVRFVGLAITIREENYIMEKIYQHNHKHLMIQYFVCSSLKTIKVDAL